MGPGAGSWGRARGAIHLYSECMRLVRCCNRPLGVVFVACFCGVTCATNETNSMGAAPESAMGSHRSCFPTTEGHWGRGSLPTAAEKSDGGDQSLWPFGHGIKGGGDQWGPSGSMGAIHVQARDSSARKFNRTQVGLR